MNIFADFAGELVRQNVRRESILNEDARKQYSTELIDTYKGFGEKYLHKKLDKISIIYLQYTN